MSSPRACAIFLILAGPASGRTEVIFRQEPTAFERVGDLLLDAKGNRVMAESLRSAPYLVVFQGSEQDAASRDFARKLAQRYQASSDERRYEVVVLNSLARRDDLLRLLRSVDAHWYGIDPAAPAGAALSALFPAAPTPPAPGLLVLDQKGALVAVNDPKGALPTAQDVLRELERRLATEVQKPEETRTEQLALRQTRRAALARELQSNPAGVSDEVIRALYPVEGMLKVKGVPHAMVAQKMVTVGDSLGNGAKVLAIEGPNVVIGVGGRRITLEPAPIPGAGSR